MNLTIYALGVAAIVIVGCNRPAPAGKSDPQQPPLTAVSSAQETPQTPAAQVELVESEHAKYLADYDAKGQRLLATYDTNVLKELSSKDFGLIKEHEFELEMVTNGVFAEDGNGLLAVLKDSSLARLSSGGRVETLVQSAKFLDRDIWPSRIVDRKGGRLLINDVRMISVAIADPRKGDITTRIGIEDVPPIYRILGERLDGEGAIIVGIDEDRTRAFVSVRGSAPELFASLDSKILAAVPINADTILIADDAMSVWLAHRGKQPQLLHKFASKRRNVQSSWNQYGIALSTGHEVFLYSAGSTAVWTPESVVTSVVFTAEGKAVAALPSKGFAGISLR